MFQGRVIRQFPRAAGPSENRGRRSGRKSLATCGEFSCPMRDRATCSGFPIPQPPTSRIRSSATAPAKSRNVSPSNLLQNPIICSQSSASVAVQIGDIRASDIQLPLNRLFPSSPRSGLDLAAYPSNASNRLQPLGDGLRIVDGLRNPGRMLVAQRARAMRAPAAMLINRCLRPIQINLLRLRKLDLCAPQLSRMRNYCPLRMSVGSWAHFCARSFDI
jgi:hypothetical protein